LALKGESHRITTRRLVRESTAAGIELIAPPLFESEVVVVSGALYHATEPDLLLAALTSKVAAATGPLDYLLGDWRAAGLRYPSALKPVLFTLDPARVIYRVGALAPADLAQVDQRLRRALEL
jgi:hypothetical protein